MTPIRKTRTALFALIAATALAGIGWAFYVGRTERGPDVAAQAAERAAIPAGMAYVPGGSFRMGTNDEDGDEEVRPQRRVFVPSFYIDRTEVTNREYARFRSDHPYPADQGDWPVTSITYDEAAAYAKWAGKRLPTQAEWEKAARGTDGRTYPWGNDWNSARVAQRAKKPGRPATPPAKELQTKDPNACLSGPVRVRRVGSVPSGVSPYGAVDMAGNAWEWVQGFHLGNSEQRLLRGGAVGYGERACRTYENAVEGAGAT